MGKINQTSTDKAQRIITGQFTAAGQESGPAVDGSEPVLTGPFNVSIWGAFTGSIALLRSFDGGATKLPCAAGDLTDARFSRPISVTVDEPEEGVTYYLSCTNLGSGQPFYRISQ